MLEAHSEGLIALSACLAGDIPPGWCGETYDAAKEKALEITTGFSVRGISI